MELVDRTTKDLPLLLSPDECADVLGVSRGMIDALIHESELRAIKVGRRKMVSRDEIQRFVLEGTSEKFRGVNSRYRKAAGE